MSEEVESKSEPEAADLKAEGLPARPRILDRGTATAALDGIQAAEMRRIIDDALLRLNYGRLAGVGSVMRTVFPPIRLVERFDCVITEELAETGLASAARFRDRREGNQEAITAAFIPSPSDPSVFTRVNLACAKFPYQRKLAEVYNSLFGD